MRPTTQRAMKVAAASGLLLAGAVLAAEANRFSDVTPLSASAGPTADEAVPITFGNPAFVQRSIADRPTQLGLSIPNTGSWDMNTLNQTGPQKGRYLFTVFETGQPGVQRHDLLTGETETIWHSPAAGEHVSFDASFWTPWGTLLTAEESWVTAPAGATSPYGRLFEFVNPLDAPWPPACRSAPPSPALTISPSTTTALYIVEDRPGGVDDDIWLAKDRNHDGDLDDEGEGLARWASNGTPGSEFTGLYFDPWDKRRAWVNIQHPASGADRTIEITIPTGTP